MPVYFRNFWWGEVREGEKNLTEGLFSKHLNSFFLTPRNGEGVVIQTAFKFQGLFNPI